MYYTSNFIYVPSRRWFRTTWPGLVLIALAIFGLPSLAISQSYYMQNGSANTCSGTFYDSGGPGGSYSNNQNYTFTFCPDNPGDFIEVSFTSFSVESGFDRLYHYDGPNTSSPYLGYFTGSSNPGTVTSTHSSGCLTFRFTSDGSVTYSGWQATVSCVSGSGGDILMQNGTINTCSGNFYDSGGPSGSYSNNEYYTLTICPDDPADLSQVSFTSFSLESGFDRLYVYDGPNTSAPYIGNYTGSNNPGTLTSTHSSGCLTFFFDSDGSVTYSGWQATISCVAGSGGDILMQNGTINTCSGTFYDSGGASGNYQNYEYSTLTICPDNPGSFLEANFTYFNLESCCDFLRIYDGSSTSDPIIGTYYGTSPGTVTSSHTSGCLTFLFDSDYSITDPGWVASLNCISNTAPTAVCQNLTRNADANCQAVVSPSEFNGGSSDPEGQTLTYSVSPMGPYPLGTTNVTLTVTDPFGLSSTCNATITVEDNTPPTINNCPATNIVVANTSGQCGAVVNYTTPTGQDNCGPAPLTQTSGLGSGAFFPVGTTTETYEIEQVSIMPNAVPSVNLTPFYGISDVAYNPIFDVYYAADGGNSTGNNYLSTYDANGNVLSQVIPSGHDWRGIWWNPNLGQLEGNSCGTCPGATGPGVRVQDLDANGVALGTGSTVLPSNQPDFQSQGDYNYDDDEIIYYHSGLIYRVNRTTNASLPTLSITGLPVSNSNLNSYLVGYSGVPGAEIMVYDYANYRVYFIDKATGAYAGTSQLPGGVPYTGPTWEVGFANGQIFLYSGNTWYGYQVVSQGAGGGSASCSFTVTVNDTEAPIAQCKNITVQLDAGGNASVSAVDVNNGSYDNCAIDEMYLSGQTNFTCSDANQTFTVTLFVEDDVPNIASCTAQVTVADDTYPCNTPPVAVCKNVYLDADANCEASAAPADFDGGSYDPEGDMITLSVSPPAPYPVGTTTVTLTVTDDHGVSDDCQATITVTDVTPPVIGVNTGSFVNPGSVSIPGNFNSELGCAGDWEPSCPNIELGYDADDQVWQGTFNIPGGNWEYKAALDDSWDENYGLGGTYFGPNIPLNLGGPTNVKFYYDPNTNWITDNVNSRIVVAAGDFQSEIGCPSDWEPWCLRSWLQDPDGDGIYEKSIAGIPAGYYETKAAINEGWAESYPASNLPFTVPDDNSLVTFRFNSYTNYYEVIITPNQACPDPIEITTSEYGCYGIGPDFLSLVNAYDNCGVIAMTQSPGVGNPIDVGTTTVTITAYDAAGLTTSCQTSVTVYDYTPPTVLCQPATVQLNGSGVASVSVSDVSAGISDACGIAESGIWNPDFGCENLGENTVYLYAFDNNGNYNQCEATVTVEDNIDPEITCPGPITSGSDPGQCGANISFNVVASDNCDETTIVCTIGGEGGDEPSSGNCATNNVDLSITFDNYPEETSWAIMNMMEQVIESGGPYVSQPDGSTLDLSFNLPDGDYMFVMYDEFEDGMCCSYGFGSYTLSSEGNLIVSGGVFAGADKTAFCVEAPSTGGMPLTEVQSGDFFPVGTTTVTCTVTDGSGNTDVCSFDITVNDTEAPMIDTPCPDNITLCGAQNVDWVPPTATDNCAVVSTVNNYDPGHYFDVGTYTVTYTFYDEAGLSVSCSFVITINPLPEVEITQDDLPLWCQGIQVLTANVLNPEALTYPLTFEWSNGLADDPIVIAPANGTYTVTVTDALGCATEVSTLVDEDISTLLSAYTIISGEEFEMYASDVIGGGVGIEDADEGEIALNSNIFTFLRADADNVQVDGTSFINDFIDDDFEIDFPPYQSNPNNVVTTLNVPANTTMTLSNSIYGYVYVEAGATLIIDNSTMYMQNLVTAKDVTIIFNQPTDLMIRRRMSIGETNTVNPDGHTCVVYVGDEASVNQGSVVTLNIYSPEGLEVNDSGATMTTYMTGLFISNDRVFSDHNVVWNWNLNCSYLPAGGVLPMAQAVNNGETIPEVSVDRPELNVYPNPTSGEINVDVELFMGQLVEYIVYDSFGKEVMRRVIDQLELPVITIDMSPAQFANGMYQVSLRGGDEMRTVRFVLSK